MDYYLAPMEGLTGHVFRQAYHRFYTDFDKYFTPFITPNQKRLLRTRERKDVDPENNEGMITIPQILTNNSKLFLDTAFFLQRMGYYEINLNLGCPASTVVTKHKGAGFLESLGKLDEFFEEVFEGLQDIQVSVKTRLGLYETEEFKWIVKVFCKYPINEIIIHPRVREEYYKGSPHYDVFEEALYEIKENSNAKVCYNGDVNSLEDAKKIEESFAEIDAIMIGRGVFRNPGILDEIKGVRQDGHESDYKFHNALVEGYGAVMSGERDVLFKMKEVWNYLGDNYSDKPGFDKLIKRIRRAKNLAEYKGAVYEVLVD